MLGNKEFKLGNYHEAIKHYGEAISKRESEIYFSNRAASYICLKKYLEAKKDCVKAIEINPDFTKAIRRHF